MTILAAFCWALGASFYKKSLANVGIGTLNFYRSIPVTIYAFLVLYLLGKWDFLYKLDTMSILYIAAATLLVLAVGDTLYFIGLRSIGVAKTVPIAYSYSIFVAVISTIFLGEPLTIPILLGTLGIIMGVWLVCGRSGNAGNMRSMSNPRVGILSALGTSLCWAAGITLFKVILTNTDPFVLASMRMLFILPLMGICTSLGGRSALHLKRSDLYTMFLSGLTALGIGDTLLYLGLEVSRANVVAPLASTTPLFAALIAILFLKERVSKSVIIGTLLVIVGTIILAIS